MKLSPILLFSFLFNPLNSWASFCSGELKSLHGDDPQKERRFNFEGREEIDLINSELGRGRKQLLLDTYNADNQYDLNRMDQTYFSALADILEYRMMQDFPELSDDLVKRRVQAQLDELMQGCRGS